MAAPIVFDESEGLPALHERELFCWNPEFSVNVPGFDSLNRPYRDHGATWKVYEIPLDRTTDQARKRVVVLETPHSPAPLEGPPAIVLFVAPPATS